MKHSTDNRMVTLLIPNDLRIGQAIINALKKTGHIDWQPAGETGKLKYEVTGTDLFYMEDKYLKKILVLPPDEPDLDYMDEEIVNHDS